MKPTITLLGIVDEDWASALDGKPIFLGHPVYQIVAALSKTDAVLIDKDFWPAFPLEIGTDGYVEIIKHPSVHEWATSHRVYNTFGQMVKDHANDPHGSDSPKNVWIMGGGQVCLEAMECAAVTHIRLIHLHFEAPYADRYFPKFNLTDWELVSDKDALVSIDNVVSLKMPSFIDQTWKRI